MKEKIETWSAKGGLLNFITSKRIIYK